MMRAASRVRIGANAARHLGAVRRRRCSPCRRARSGPTRRSPRPAAGSCRRSSARTAPASTAMAPAGFSVPAIHCLRVASGVEVGTNQVQRAPVLDALAADADAPPWRCTSGSPRPPRSWRRRSWSACRPNPSALLDAARHGLDLRRDLEHAGDEFGVRVAGADWPCTARRCPTAAPGNRRRHLRHPRGQAVVVAVADLGGRHRVVLVDDRHRAQRQQRVEGAARIQIAAALLGVARGQQNLRHRDVVRSSSSL